VNEVFACNRLGVTTVAEFVCTHPLLSVIVTVYDPAHKAVAVGPVPPEGAHEYEYPGVPPDALTDANPSHVPKQLTDVDPILSTIAEG
jgi:hypothetical protein